MLRDKQPRFLLVPAELLQTDIIQRGENTNEKFPQPCKISDTHHRPAFAFEFGKFYHVYALVPANG
jgi:hypothetical protein